MDNSAVQNSNNTEIGDYFTMIRRRKWKFILPFTLVLVASIALAVLLPPIYRSTAIILVQKDNVPTELIETTVTGYVQERIDLVTQRVLTSKNLTTIARENVILPQEQLVLSVPEIGQLMREAITIEVVELSSGSKSSKGIPVSVRLGVSFDSYSPVKAQLGASKISELILNENRRIRIDQAKDVVMFLEDESNKMLEKLVSLEKKLAQLKQEQYSQLPEQINLNRQYLSQAEIQLDKSVEEILKLQNQKIQTQSQLSTTDRYGADSETPEQRLVQARVDFSEARQKYSSRHPDVISLQRLVESLENEVYDYRVNGLGKSTDISTVSNPEYIRISTLLNTINRNIAAQQDKKIRLEKKIASYQQSIYQTPQVEIEYTSIMREYENVNREYLNIAEKQLQARLAMELERGQKAGTFSLIEFPVTPMTPFKPNRLGIVLLGFMLACAAGIAYAFLAEVFDRTIRGSKELANVIDVPPISVISYFEVDEKSYRIIDKDLKKTG